ncbi:MAG TPA: proliferating cell nuclear antigen (pcna) [Methanomassiliicoccales archaeon]|nr:proliferating cell nuclear antigen (pcna) [Methanomassiliicoccales archaeon]HPR98185.1 proliferating cell nuclear antigen (pcna) [Methanomassiliicoccales archaeon]
MFQAKLRSDILKGIVDVVSTLIDEAKFKIGENGIQLKAVDPAHVAMIDLTLGKDAFEQYSAAETDLGLDLEKLKEVIRLSKSGDLIEMRQDEERGRLVLMVGNVTRRMNLVSTEGMSDPKVPNLTLPARITVTVDELQRGIKAAESISDHVALNANTEGFEMVSDGDTDSVSLKLPKALLVDLQCSESIRSLFPMDYFSTIIKAIPSGTNVSVNLGNDLPVRLDFDIAGGKGSVRYLLAPRIEND